MARDVDLSKPLSDKDREYLLSRGLESHVERADEMAGSAEDEEMDDLPPYEEMTVEQLDAEIAERNSGRVEGDKLVTTGNKQTKIERLRADDEAAE